MLTKLPAELSDQPQAVRVICRTCEARYEQTLADGHGNHVGPWTTRALYLAALPHCCGVCGSIAFRLVRPGGAA